MVADDPRYPPPSRPSSRPRSAPDIDREKLAEIEGTLSLIGQGLEGLGILMVGDAFDDEFPMAPTARAKIYSAVQALGVHVSALADDLDAALVQGRPAGASTDDAT